MITILIVTIVSLVIFIAYFIADCISIGKKIEKLNKKSDRHIDTIRRLHSEIDKLQADKITLAEKIKTLKEEWSIDKSDLANAGKEMKSLMRNVCDSEKEIKELTAQNSKLSMEKANLKTDNERVNKKLDEINAADLKTTESSFGKIRKFESKPKSTPKKVNPVAVRKATEKRMKKIK